MPGCPAQETDTQTHRQQTTGAGAGTGAGGMHRHRHSNATGGPGHTYIHTHIYVQEQVACTGTHICNRKPRTHAHIYTHIIMNIRSNLGTVSLTDLGSF